jgi:hypothetical protein
MRTVFIETPSERPGQQRYELISSLHVVGNHIAPPGHNRDLDVNVEFHLLPSKRPCVHFPAVNSGLESLYERAVEGLCEVFFSHVPFPLIGFEIVHVKIGPEPLNSLLPISCKRAALKAANQVLTQHMDQWRLAALGNK